MFRYRIVIVALILCMAVRDSSSIGPLPTFFWPAPMEADSPDQDDEPMPDPENVVVEASDVTNMDRIDTMNVCIDLIDTASSRVCFHVTDSTFTPPATDTIYALKQLRI